MGVQTRIWVRKIHKWLGLLLGIQLVLWVTGGVVMSLIPIEQVRGTPWLPAPESKLTLAAYRFPVQQLPVATAAEVRLATRLGKPVYLVIDPDGHRRVFSAQTGEPLPEVSPDAVSAWVQQLHRDRPPVVAVTRIDKPEGEVRGREAPLWRVDLDDAWNMRVYVDAITGQVVARRNDLWRFYDFFWMLHIMDYDAREDFNNNLLRASAGLAWFFVLSGLWLIVYSFRRQDFRWFLRIHHRRRR